MSMTGDYLTMAEACGEVERPSVWIPGEDFDPRDEFEMEVMHDVWERERFDEAAALERENQRLERENQRLRERVAALSGAEEPDREPTADQERAWDDQYDGTAFGA